MRFIRIFLLLSAFCINSAVKSEPLIVGYFPAKVTYVEALPLIRAPAGQLTHLIYELAVPREDGEIEARFSFSDNVQDQGVSVGKSYQGNFSAVRELKRLHPGLKVLIRVGGWRGSKYFSDIAASPELRLKFVRSYLELVNEYGFDGMELDWRFPGGRGAKGNSVAEDDLDNFYRLTAEIRRACKQCQLAVTVPDKPMLRGQWDFSQLTPQVDFFILLSHHFKGGWNLRTGHRAPLYTDPSYPELSLASIVAELINLGLPRNKLVFTVPTFGVGWQGVENIESGFGQAHKGMAVGTRDDRGSGATGEFAYRHILQLIAGGGYQVNWDDSVKASSLYSDKTGIFISYEGRRSLDQKLHYASREQLAGVAITDITSDAPGGSSLLSLVHEFHYPFYSYYYLIQQKIERYLPWFFGIFWGGIVAGCIFLFYSSKRYWRRRQFIRAMRTLPVRALQISRMAAKPPVELFESMTTGQKSSLQQLANCAGQLHEQLVPMASLDTYEQLRGETSVNDVSAVEGASALLALDKFNKQIQAQGDLAEMLGVMFSFLVDDNLVDSAQLFNDKEMLQASGTHHSSVPLEYAGEGVLVLDQSRYHGKISGPDLFDYQLLLNFRAPLCDTAEVYFTALANQVVLARKQVRQLVDQPQLLSELHQITRCGEKLTHIKGERGYSGVYAQGDKAPAYIYLSLRALKAYFPDLLIQVHRSYLISPKAVDKGVKLNSGFGLQIGKLVIPVARSYVKQLKVDYPDWFEFS